METELHNAYNLDTDTLVTFTRTPQWYVVTAFKDERVQTFHEIYESARAEFNRLLTESETCSHDSLDEIFDCSECSELIDSLI